MLHKIPFLKIHSKIFHNKTTFWINISHLTSTIAFKTLSGSYMLNYKGIIITQNVGSFTHSLTHSFTHCLTTVAKLEANRSFIWLQLFCYNIKLTNGMCLFGLRGFCSLSSFNLLLFMQQIHIPSF